MSKNYLNSENGENNVYFKKRSRFSNISVIFKWMVNNK